MVQRRSQKRWLVFCLLEARRLQLDREVIVAMIEGFPDALLAAPHLDIEIWLNRIPFLESPDCLKGKRSVGGMSSADGISLGNQR